MLQGKLPLALAVRLLTSRTFSYDISNVSAALAWGTILFRNNQPWYRAMYSYTVYMYTQGRMDV